MPLSPPVTMITSCLATSTIATALSTAESAMSTVPAASPSRCRVEFSVNESSGVMPCRAKMPFATPACSGSAFALGNALMRSGCAIAVAIQAISAIATSDNQADLMSADHLRSRLLQDAPHTVGELVVELRELGGVLEAILELVVGEKLLPRLGLRELVEHVLPIGHVFLGD